MEVKGYKAFNGDMTNQFGMLFEEGKTYETMGEIIPGQYNYGKMNGYHMSKRLSNCFRYFDSEKNGIQIAEVTGSGICREFEDERNRYYDMYACERITVDRILSREEWISIMLEAPSFEVENFLMTIKLTPFEIRMFADKYKNDFRVLQHILYYQLNDEHVFESSGSLPDNYQKVLGHIQRTGD